MALDTDIALHPGEGIFLPDREDHVIRGIKLLAGDALGLDAALGINFIFHDIEQHALQFAVFEHEGFRHKIDRDNAARGF